MCFKKRDSESDAAAALRQKQWNKDCDRFFKRTGYVSLSAAERRRAQAMYDSKDRAGLREMLKQYRPYRNNPYN